MEKTLKDEDHLEKVFGDDDGFFQQPWGIFTISFSSIFLLTTLCLLIYFFVLKLKRRIYVDRNSQEEYELDNLN